MYFQQSDLLRGMNKEFIKTFMDITEKESHEKGRFLFREGDPAKHFYILLKGRIKLSIGEEGHIVYAVDHSGEAFGWSSLVGRERYSASAECREETKLLKVDVTKLHEILKKEPENGFHFYKHLAATLGNRLLQTYGMISATSQPGISVSFGTGDVQESEATMA